MDASRGGRNWISADDSALLGSAHPRNNQLPISCRVYALTTLRTVFFGPIPAPMQQMIDLIFCQASLYAHHVTMWSTLDGQLYDIPLTEWLYKREYRPRLHLQIGDLTDDMSAVKMTGFNVSQLRRLYHHFGLREFVQAHNETVLRIGTGHWSNGLEKCYRIHPEELFLFSLTKCKTGMTNERIIDMFVLWWGL